MTINAIKPPPYFHIKKLCYAGKDYPSNFSREQKIAIKQRLMSLINEKFPNKETGVSHMGYAIISEASVQHFNLDNFNNGQSIVQLFERLEKETYIIDNVADRSLILGMLAAECPNKKKSLDLLLKAFSEADKIVTVREKISRYESALESALSLSTELFNAKLKEIQQDILMLDDSDAFPTFRRLIDLAFRHDKNVAQKLVSSLDNDPGRKKLSEPVTDHFEKLELEKNVLNDYSQFSLVRDRRQIANIAWKMLGQLNAQKRISRSVEQTIAVLQVASKLPFYYSIPLYEFFLQNAIKHNSSTDNLLMSFYESTYSGASMCYSLISNSKNKIMSLAPYNNVPSNSTFVARPGSRKQSFEFIGRVMQASNSLEIYIIDPYFKESDVSFLKQITEWCYGAETTILTSCESNGEFIKSTYSNAWDKVSSENTPIFSFICASNQIKKSPFHDRWIIMHDKKQGLKLGTSINSLGEHKVSQISIMSEEEVQEVYSSVVVPLIKQRVRRYEDQTIKEEHVVKYEMFDL